MDREEGKQAAGSVTVDARYRAEADARADAQAEIVRHLALIEAARLRAEAAEREVERVKREGHTVEFARERLRARWRHNWTTTKAAVWRASRFALLIVAYRLYAADSIFLALICASSFVGLEHQQRQSLLREAIVEAVAALYYPKRSSS